MNITIDTLYIMYIYIYRERERYVYIYICIIIVYLGATRSLTDWAALLA